MTKAKTAPELVPVQLLNGHSTSGGNGPGVVRVPPDEAQPYVDQGYAVRVAS
jgi:hypothetical protein